MGVKMMKKRLLSILLTSVMALSVLAGCSSSTPNPEDGAGGGKEDSGSVSEKNTVTVWCWDPTFNIYAMEEAAKIYNKENPDVKINVVETAWEDIQTKLTAAATAQQYDTLPDIMLMQDNALAKNIINFPDVFLDLTDTDIDFDSFAEYKVALSTVDGKNYGVPFDNGAAISVLRTDYLEQAGFTIEDFTDITWDEFLDKGKVVLEKTGKPMLSNISGEPDLLMVMMQSAGTWLFDKDGNVNFTDNEILKKVVETYVELVKAGVVVEVNDWDQYISTLNSSTVAGTVNGSWIIGSIQAAEDQSGLWGITNIPKLEGIDGATNYSNQGGSSWLVKKDSKVKDIAVDFLSKTFAGSAELYETILPSSGAIATYLPAGESDAYSKEMEFFKNDKIYEKILDYASKVPQVSYGVYNYEARDSIGTAITKIVSGTDIEKALKEAEDEVKFQMGQ